MAVAQPGVWGIDLGQCALKAIRLENVGGEVAATAFDYIEHPKILSQPDADPDELTREALQQFLSRNSIKGDVLVISVPGQSGLARFVKLPPVEEKKIADIVKFEAKQQIPFPLEEVVWDFQKIGHGVVTDGFAMETEIGLFAMKKDMVHRALQQFKDVHVEIQVIQMAPLALCNYVAYDLLAKNGLAGEGGEAGGKKECVVALDIGTDNSNLIITDGEKIIWQRPIPLGGNHFTRALTKDMKLTFAKAEHLKRNAVKSPDLKKILASLKTVLNDFVGEVQRSLGYFTNTHRDASIEYMIGLGNAFRLPGLQKYLQEKLQLEVRKLSKLERCSGEAVTQPTFTENLLSFAVAYGLALQGLKLSRIQTNLLPPEIRIERLVRGKKPWAVAAAASLLLAVAGLTFGYSVEKKAVDNSPGSEIKRKADDAKKALTTAENLKRDFEKELAEKKGAEEKVKRMSAGLEQRFNWQQLYQYINMALPRPNGDKLVEATTNQERVKSVYFTKEAREAFATLELKRGGVAIAPETEEKMKKNLVQISIEGINTLYTEDFTYYWRVIDHLLKSRFPGMTHKEQTLVLKYTKASEAEALTAKAELPTKAWIVEIRGYTYNGGAEQFVETTFLENLANPYGPGDKLTPEMKETIDKVKSRISYLLLLKNEQVLNPQPGVFKHIQKSMLRTLISDPGADKLDPKRSLKFDPQVQMGFDRDVWRPNGDVASSAWDEVLNVREKKDLNVPDAPPPAKDNAPNIPLQPRTEFIIVFLWDESLPPPVPGAASAAPALFGQSPTPAVPPPTLDSKK